MLLRAMMLTLSCLAALQVASQPSLQAGAYSEEQAVRGQTLYYQHCLACHGETMAGLEQAPPLTGPQFNGNWRGVSLQALVDRIGTMPPDKPGTLLRQEAVDILAYMLWYNGLPIGESALSTEQDSLSAMTFGVP